MKNRLFFFFTLFIAGSCNDPVEEIDCSTLALELITKSDPTTCSPPDGQITVMAQGGAPPYLFRINNENFQSEASFTDLSGGDHLVTAIDVNQCEQTISVQLTNFNSSLDATVTVVEDTGCLTGNGSALFNPSGGQEPYQLRIGNILVNNSFEVTDLKHGVHQIFVIDALQCEVVKSVQIPRGSTGISFVNEIKPIIDTRCAKPTCHVPTTGRADLTKLENIQQLAAQIKTRTQNKSMPFDEPMPDEQIQLIACWVDDGALNN